MSAYGWRTNCQVGQFSCEEMALRGGTTGAACAACKHQRRKCKPYCALAPYFPSDQQGIFQCVHKLYGVSKILKILDELDDRHKPEAMHAIKYESYIRDKEPVHGCLGIIRSLEYKIMCYQQELQAVRQQIALFKLAAQYQPVSSLPAPGDSGTSQLESGTPTPPSKNVGSVHNESTPQACGVVPAVSSDNIIPLSSTGYNYTECIDQEPENPTCVQQHHSNNSNVCGGSMAENQSDQLIASQQQPHQLPTQQEVGQVYNDDPILPFLNTIDDRQSYRESKEACDPSLDERMKDTSHSIKVVGEKELRDAAVIRLSLESCVN